MDGRELGLWFELTVSFHPSLAEDFAFAPDDFRDEVLWLEVGKNNPRVSELPDAQVRKRSRRARPNLVRLVVEGRNEQAVRSLASAEVARMLRWLNDADTQAL